MLTVEEAAQQLRIGRTQMFALIKSQQVSSVKIGRSRRVPRAALDTYVEQLGDEQHGAAA
ncbi:helix-turn-helix domain-containing protein [Micromonospora terminaliae]|uniref:Excisionase family DNA-binding protein n=2 Tax=Micromonospora terminaliae TaxID=1914461 RepID=A0AAJ2ZFH5_9ACTN|nr:excisionase family DNA-binding protein [Micromonospora terminaliae]NES28957.1 excisionase family DNA-binding protein [Micromonospora terminaliae]QGL51491.1 helix-turn-helix domain-containing protein [Micromonospora terminaliae]